MTNIRKRVEGWRRFPTPDCPLCHGSGVIEFIASSACGDVLFDGNPMRGNCRCVLAPGRRPTNESLQQTRERLSQ